MDKNYLLKKITITRKEGKRKECDIDHVVTTWRGTDKLINEMAKTAPKMGYDKTKFVVEMQNENYNYTGRLDLNKTHIDKKNIIIDQIINTYKFYAGDNRPKWMEESVYKDYINKQTKDRKEEYQRAYRYYCNVKSEIQKKEKFNYEKYKEVIAKLEKKGTEYTKIIDNNHIEITNKNGSRIFHQAANGEWTKRKYDKQENCIYFETENGYLEESKYDKNNNKIYKETSDGVQNWTKYDRNNKEIYDIYKYENEIMVSTFNENKTYTIELRRSEGMKKCREIDIIAKLKDRHKTFERWINNGGYSKEEMMEYEALDEVMDAINKAKLENKRNRAEEKLQVKEIVMQLN